MSELINFTEKVDLNDFTLIIPSVSVGNVPQLTIDVIVATYNLKKVATIWHPSIIPTIGSDPFYGTQDICTACELLINEDLKIAVIQLRSHLDKKFTNRFYDDLRKELLKFNLKNIIILGSGFAYEMHDVKSSKYRYASNDFTKETFEKLNVLELCLSEDQSVPGTGFGYKMYHILKEELKTTFLIKYISEGDNRPDAVDVYSLLTKLLQNLSSTVQLKFPVSWEYVFGNPPPIGIY